ncbi:hypothetical protein ACQRXC_03980 [Niallia taxi]|uniref:hypothetical protein n=1 Tax=Niallia taxi TaxID=2499688 RepID=UPI003F648EA9
MSKVAQILRLCDSWRKHVLRDDGGISISVESENYRLLKNGIVYPDLSYEEIQSCCLGLTRVMFMKRMNSIQSADHKYFWAWVGEVLLGSESNFFSDEEHHIRKLFESCIRSTLATQDYRDDIEFNSSELLSNNSLILAHLSFPLLESLLKKLCKEYVDISGRVLKPFEIRLSRNRVIQYGTGQKNKISSLRDLLYLYENYVSNEEGKEHLNLFKQCISDVDNSMRPYDLIYQWRNHSLHGQFSYSTIGGTILNLIILLSLNNIKDNYENRRGRSKETSLFYLKALQNSASNARPGWSFYPPVIGIQR